MKFIGNFVRFHPVPPRSASARITSPLLVVNNPKGVSMTNDLMTTKEAADYVRLSKPTLERLRVAGEGPAYVKLFRSVRYRRVDLDEWVASCVKRSTSH